MTVARLDYPAEKLQPFGREKLLMECNNEIEKAMRVVACSKEPWTVAFIEGLAPGEVFWDIGACVGSYSLVAAARGLQVVAFEPVLENAATLCRNLALNDLLSAVIVMPMGLGDGHGLIWQHRSDMRSGAASHAMTPNGRKRTHHQQLVAIWEGDVLASAMKMAVPHAIKIDVDGFEQQVLVGMQQLLMHAQLRTMLIELQIKNDAAVLAWLKERSWGIVEKYEDRGGIYYATFGRC